MFWRWDNLGGRLSTAFGGQLTPNNLTLPRCSHCSHGLFLYGYLNVFVQFLCQMSSVLLCLQLYLWMESTTDKLSADLPPASTLNVCFHYNCSILYILYVIHNVQHVISSNLN